MTAEKNQFQPCMVGTLESQFLKMQAQIKGAKNCLDVGTFTGMSAVAFAEGVPADGKVHTLENSEEVAKIAQEAFSASSVGSKIVLHVGDAKASMEKLKADGVKFDIIFLDADKENYIAYYDLAMSGLLAGRGCPATRTAQRSLAPRHRFRTRPSHSDPRAESASGDARAALKGCHANHEKGFEVEDGGAGPRAGAQRLHGARPEDAAR